MQLKPFKNRYLRRFASLRVGVLLMVGLALISIFGTALPYEKSLAIVFYSWWFRAFLILLAVNLILCTYQGLAVRVLPSVGPRFQKAEEFYESRPMSFSFASARSPEQVQAVLSMHGFRVFRDGDYFYARKGILGAFSAPIAHTGFLLVLLGGFASGFLAFNGHVRLNEGEATTTMRLTGKEGAVRPLGFSVRCLDFQTATFPQTEIPSQFVTTLEVIDGKKRFVASVEVNKALKYRGLKFHQSGFGKVPGRVRYHVLVNDLSGSQTVEAIADVGRRTALEGWNRDLLLTRSAAGLRYAMLEGEKTIAAGFLRRTDSNSEIMAVRFVPDFLMGENGKVVSRSQQMNNPALQVVWVQDGKPADRQWLFSRPELRGFSHRSQDAIRLELEQVNSGGDGKQHFGLAAYDSATNALLGRFTLSLGDKVRLADLGGPASESGPEPSGAPPAIAGTGKSERYRARLLGTEPLFYTDLSVSHNPMIAVIYLGSILVCLGICFALYLRRTNLWLWCQDSGERFRVVVRYAPARTTLAAREERTVEALK